MLTLVKHVQPWAVRAVLGLSNHCRAPLDLFYRGQRASASKGVRRVAAWLAHLAAGGGRKWECRTPVHTRRRWRAALEALRRRSLDASQVGSAGQGASGYDEKGPGTNQAGGARCIVAAAACMQDSACPMLGGR